jgi:WhiB family redox-sensing transcriptional regulator
MARYRRLPMSRMTDFCEWWELAACQSADPELFFPVSETGPDVAQVARAKAICQQCSVRQDCLEYAISTRQVHGVWGGMSERERRLRRISVAS